MRRRLATSAIFYTSLLPLSTSRCQYYDKIREEREGSDEGPAAMFYEFPKNPSACRVPDSFHTTSSDAVSTAENIQRCFILVSVVLAFVLCFSGFMDPFGGAYRRPEGYGMQNSGSETG